MSERKRWIRIAGLPAVALLMVLWAGSAMAQNLAVEDPQAFQEQFRKATGEEMDRLEEMEAERVRMIEEGQLSPAVFNRGASILDRAYGYIYVSDLEFRIFNAGARRGGQGVQCEWYYGVPAGYQDSRETFWWDASVAFGVEDGPWGNAQVHESVDTYYNDHEVGDWEATDGARGDEFADPPATRYGMPLMATSNLENTWPASGWPAPEDIEAVWQGTEMWHPWARVAEMEAYGTFDDSEAGRDGRNEAYPLGIEGKVRALGYGAYDAAFVQVEFTNTSSDTYTGVFVGHHGRRGFPTYDDGNVGYPEWDESRQMTYVIGGGFDPATGIHYNDDIWWDGANPYSQAPWGGMVYLESPTGSFRTDALGNYVDDPTTVITRNAWTHRDDRVRPETGGNEAMLYGAVSGDLSYFGSDNLRAEIVWKMTAAGDGVNPVLLQDSEDFNLYWFETANPTQAELEDKTSTGYAYTHAGPFDMAPGESVNFVYAQVAGETLFEMQATADKAIRSYQAQFQASGPPPSPVLEAGGVKAGPAGKAFDPRIHSYRINYVDSGPIMLMWDGSEAETFQDPITLNRDFQGYRIYKSNDRGRTWGEILTTETAGFGAWAPAAQFDLDDGIAGRDPQGYQSLGTDTGIQHTWTDNSVIDGMEYWYAITSYDYDPAQDPNNHSMESNVGINPTVPNVISVIAGSKPGGYLAGAVDSSGTRLSTTSLDPAAGPVNDATVTLDILDDSAVPDGTYRISFTDTADYGTITGLSNTLGVTLTNLTSGDVLFESMLPEDDDYGTDLLPVVDGLKVEASTLFNGVDPYDRLSHDFGESVWSPPSGYEIFYGTDWFMSPTISVWDVHDAGTEFSSVEVRFDSTDTQYAYAFNRTGGYFYRGYVEVPFTVWDVSSEPERQINFSYTVQSSKTDLSYDVDDDPWGTNRHYTAFLSSDYSGDATPDTAYTTGTMSDWRYGDIMFATVGGTEDTTDIGDMDGETISFTYERPISPVTEYEFTTVAPTNDESVADLDEIRVVPNPYYVFAAWDKNENQRKIQFRNVPPNSTVDIYTLSGELLASLEHSESGYHADQIGTVEWNIWTYEFTEAAYGLYLYVVKTADGQKKVGKFAIIR